MLLCAEPAVLFLVGAALDVKSAIRTTGQHLIFIEAIGDVGAQIVPLDSDIQILDVKGDSFTKSTERTVKR